MKIESLHPLLRGGPEIIKVGGKGGVVCCILINFKVVFFFFYVLEINMFFYSVKG